MTHVLVTIDTETPQTSLLSGSLKKPLFKSVFHGEDWGVAKIIEICRARNCKPTFFTNVYETALWGDSAMAELLEQIAASGTNAELHTHPCWMFDSRREHMWQYSLSEQKAIVGKGIELFEKLGGQRPAAHRAGGYGINDETFQALDEAGIGCDCSVLHGHRNCRSRVTINKPVSAHNVLELPVTVFRNGHNRLVRADPERISPPVMPHLLSASGVAGVSVLTVILHSYSLINNYWDTKAAEPNPDAVGALESILDAISMNSNTAFISVQDIMNDDSLRAQVMSGTDIIPTVDDERTLFSDIRRYWKYRGLVGQRFRAGMKGRKLCH